MGIDFAGYIVLPHHRLIRTKTKRRIFKKLKNKIQDYKTGDITSESIRQSLSSCLGHLSHANGYNVCQNLKNYAWFWFHN